MPVAAVKPASRSAAIRRSSAVGLMIASGFAGLGYQIVWAQQSAVWLGHESAAVLAVVAAVFGGMGLGALTFGDAIERSSRPACWYAACEATIGSWSLVLTACMAPFTGWLLRLTGAQPTPVWQWFVAFTGTLLLLLPATAAMGATLPAMQRVLAHARSERAGIAGLYAANTGGAVLGVLGVALWLIPALGLGATVIVCAAMNFACAALALALFPQSSACIARRDPLGAA